MRRRLLFDRSAALLIDQAADQMVRCIIQAWLVGREAHIVLTGGRSGQQLCKAIDLALHRAILESDVENDALRVHYWLSDERYESLHSPDRTGPALEEQFAKTAHRSVFHQYRAPESATVLEVADSYQLDLRESIGDAPFDCSALSLGEDGHIASCFPNHTTQADSQSEVQIVTDAPKPPPVRTTLSLARLANARQVVLLAIGESKRHALGEVIEGNLASPVVQLEQLQTSGELFVYSDLM